MQKTLTVPRWEEKVVFSDTGPKPQFLWEDEKLKVIFGGLKAGQAIPPHPEALAVYHFLAGEGVMMVDQEQYAVKAGTTVIVPKGAKRGINAETRLAFLAVRVA